MPPIRFLAPIRIARARPRLLLSASIGLLAAWLVPESLIKHAVSRAIFGWNIGALLYLSLAAHLMFGAPKERMKLRAREQDEGRFVVLGLVVLAAVISLSSVIAQLSLARDLTGMQKYDHVALAALTIATSWAFTQTMFALHYAHDYYLEEGKGHPPGLDFPGGHAPDYGDFLYLACIIGTSGQTADVSFSNRSMRRIGLIHCVLAFFFNTTVLALCINIASSML